MYPKNLNFYTRLYQLSLFVSYCLCVLMFSFLHIISKLIKSESNFRIQNRIICIFIKDILCFKKNAKLSLWRSNPTGSRSFKDQIAKLSLSLFIQLYCSQAICGKRSAPNLNIDYSKQSWNSPWNGKVLCERYLSVFEML